MPTDDLAEPGRTFFAYRTTGGLALGFGGYELQGRDVLVRSVVVLPEARGKEIGRNLLALLLRPAFDEGARTAWLLTTTAPEFFEKVGFRRTPRLNAPTAILATRQAASLGSPCMMVTGKLGRRSAKWVRDPHSAFAARATDGKPILL